MKKISPLHKRYLLVVGILLVVIFYLSKCKGTTQPVITTPTKALKDTVKIIVSDNKRITDSFETILRKHYKQDYQDSNYLIELLNQNSELSAINNNLQKETYPDTCAGIVKKYQDRYSIYEAQTNKTLNQAKQSLINLSGTVQTQKSYLSEKDKLYDRIKKVADTCLSNSAALEKYIKKINPKHELGLMISGMNDFSNKNFKPAIGAGLTWRNKRGLQIGASYYSNQTGSIFIIKPLIRL